MTRKTILTQIGLLLVVVGCTPTTTASHTAPAMHTKDASTVKPATNKWKPLIAAGKYSYIIRDSARISITADSTQSIPIETTTFLSVNSTIENDSIQLDGSLDSLIRTMNQVTVRDTTGISRLKVRLSNLGRFPEASTSNTDCRKKVNPIQLRITEIMPSYPADTMKVGDAWSDTISTTSCHGKTLLVQENIRKFEVLELGSWQQYFSVKIRRLITSTVSNAPGTLSNRITATGTGWSSSIIFVNTVDGSLLKSVGDAHSKLSVTTSRGVFPFVQILHTDIERGN